MALAQPLVTDLEQAERWMDSLDDEQQRKAIRELLVYWKGPAGATFTTDDDPPVRVPWKAQLINKIIYKYSHSASLVKQRSTQTFGFILSESLVKQRSARTSGLQLSTHTRPPPQPTNFDYNFPTPPNLY